MSRMSQFVLVSGANSSGKSRYAEQLIAGTSGPRYYIATMIPCTDENHRRIAKHRIQRKNLGFQTIESPYEVGNVSVSPDGIVLLEDVSNLLANAMFEKKSGPEQVYQDICSLAERCRMLVAVTISGLSTEGCDAETASYVDALNRINQKLSNRASAVVSMQDGLPVYRKGESPDVPGPAGTAYHIS
jgi:adenosylcobinamide kinase/adenosylcobinamide-phosphate guanylyltransferase